MGKNATPRPGQDGYYDQTNNIRPLTLGERAGGWEIVICMICEMGARRVMASCGLCKGKGRIRVLNPERSSDEEVPGRKRGGRWKKSALFRFV